MKLLLPARARARIHHANHKSPLLACRILPRIVICCAEWSRVNQTASVNSHRLPNPRDFSRKFLAACVRIRSLRARERLVLPYSVHYTITAFLTYIIRVSFNSFYVRIYKYDLLTVVDYHWTWRSLWSYSLLKNLAAIPFQFYNNAHLCATISPRLGFNTSEFFPFSSYLSSFVFFSFLQIIHFSHKREQN